MAMPAVTTLSIAVAFAVPRATSVKWTPLVAVSLNARTR